MSASFYARRVLPVLLDWACRQELFSEQRRRLVPRAAGRVLELGAGTGLNFAYYDRAKVRRLVALDPAASLREKARQRAAQAGLDVELVTAPAEAIPAEGASFDAVVMTYTLCSVADPRAALREARRVLAPGGLLLFCEHGLAPDPGVQAWQRRLDRVWPAVAGGCHLSRDVLGLLREAGFAFRDVEKGYLSAARPWAFHYRGEAAAA